MMDTIQWLPCSVEAQVSHGRAASIPHFDATKVWCYGAREGEIIEQVRRGRRRWVPVLGSLAFGHGLTLRRSPSHQPDVFDTAVELRLAHFAVTLGDRSSIWMSAA
jgi:hypothetical protein